jgi:hypothetical protein
MPRFDVVAPIALLTIAASPLFLSAQEPTRTVIAVFRAISRADTAALRPLLGDDLRWVYASSGAVGDKAQLLAAAATRIPMATSEYAVDSVQTWRNGDVAVAEYRLTSTRAFRKYRLKLVSRATDVLALRGGAWLLMRHSTTWIVRSPLLSDIDSAHAAVFVGQYDKGGGFVDDVHFHDGRLVAQSTLEKLIGTPGAMLRRVSDDTFSPDGIAPMIVFERDATGRVVGYVQQSPDGTITRARRVPP